MSLDAKWEPRKNDYTPPDYNSKPKVRLEAELGDIFKNSVMMGNDDLDHFSKPSNNLTIK